MAAEPLRPEALRAHYGAFLRADRVLLTGHSHQAWPDVARAGLAAAFDDAAAHVDDKWQRATEVADGLRAAVVRAHRRCGRPDRARPEHARAGLALPLGARPAPATATGHHAGEFHSLDRQLRRLSEEGVEVSLRGRRAARLAARSARRGNRRTHRGAPGLDRAVRDVGVDSATCGMRSRRRSASAPRCCSTPITPSTSCRSGSTSSGRDPVFVTAGGYKYAQWGEGCCFLRVPPATAAAPGLHRLVQRLRPPRQRARPRPGPLRRKAVRPLRRQHLRPDEPLPRARRHPTSSASRVSTSRACGNCRSARPRGSSTASTASTY